MESIAGTVSQDSFLPHGVCLLWNRWLLWLSAGADVLISLAYFSIPLALLYFVKKRRDLEHARILLLFASFIMLCGTTHLLGAIILWNPIYYIDVVAKVATAIVSVYTAFVIWPLIPTLLTIPSPSRLEHANKLLREENSSKIAASELKESEERWKFALEGAGDGAWDWNLRTNEAVFSRRYKEIIGYSDGDPFDKGGEEWSSRVHEEDMPQMMAAIQEHMDGKTTSARGEFRMRCKNGSYKWILGRGTVVKRDADGKPLRMVGTNSDITERKLAEEKLIQNKRILQESQSIAGVGSYSLDISAGRWDGSEVLDELFGIDKSHEHSVEGWAAIVHPDDRTMMTDYFRDEVVGRRAAFDKEYRIVRQDDGEVRWVHGLGRLEFDADGRPKIMHGTIQDITRQKLEELNLRLARDDAEKATKTKDKFVSLVAHDLKSPLAGMLSLLKLVCNDKSRSIDPGLRQILEKTIDSGNQLTRTINDVLDLSRLRTGTLVLDKQFFDAKYLGAKICDDFAYSASQKQITLTNDIPDNSRLHADKTLLGEALQNLVTNSIKFCRSGDTITLSLSTGEKTGIQVTDTGPGVSPEILNSLINNEKITSTMGTLGEPGTGLGLQLAKEIMNLHGGEITMASSADKGSVFALNIPIVKPRILIVDDDETFRFLVTTILKMLDADISEAYDGSVAVEKLEKTSEFPHLIISDIEMPNLNGLEFLSYLQKRHETRTIPVIVVSGKHGMEVRETVYNLGGKDFLRKDIDIDDFLPRVRRFIS